MDDLMLGLSQDQEFMDKIIELNTEVQLYQKGVDSTGRTFVEMGLGYTPYTIQLKEEKGQPTDRVTLKDTGDFYASFRVTLNSNYDLEITANPIKDSTDLLREYGKDVLGLTRESLDILVDLARKKLPSILRNQLINAA